MHEMNNWISVNDRLPPNNKLVLTYANGDIKILTYVVVDDSDNYGHWWADEYGDFHSEIADGDVTHWMPLPPPPKSNPTQQMAVLTVPHDNS